MKNMLMIKFKELLNQLDKKDSFFQEEKDLMKT